MDDDQSGRINQLEEALAHQEMLVHDLSDVLNKQWQAIERMSRRLQELEEKIDSLKSTTESPEAGEPPPPHY
ncbi:MAG: SlyX family protein [Rhodospirillaceae bacterium]|nr:SlyX family protein [Rhodospirillaceae bacterium]MBL6933601.1 SlyX family protein [Rhodospirillales bacterium]